MIRASKRCAKPTPWKLENIAESKEEPSKWRNNFIVQEKHVCWDLPFFLDEDMGSTVTFRGAVGFFYKTANQQQDFMWKYKKLCTFVHINNFMEE